MRNKNTLNIVVVLLILVVMGCSCNKLQELANQSSSTPSSSPSTSSSPSSTSSPSKSSDEKATLTLDKYNQIKNGMSYKEVVDIIGSEGTEISSSGDGKYKVESYKWDGGDFKWIFVTLMGGKVTAKTQSNLK